MVVIPVVAALEVAVAQAAAASEVADKYALKGFAICQHALKSQLLKFRMWFKYGLKAQKLLAQGIALGIIAINKAPCKGKSFVNCLILLKLLPLQGDKLASMITQGAALG